MNTVTFGDCTYPISYSPTTEAIYTIEFGRNACFITDLLSLTAANEAAREKEFPRLLRLLWAAAKTAHDGPGFPRFNRWPPATEKGPGTLEVWQSFNDAVKRGFLRGHAGRS